MISFIVTLIILLLIVGLLIWATDLLAGVGLPPRVLVILKVLIVLIAVLWLVQWLGVGPAWWGPPPLR
jgi:hypothetical protein